MSAMAAWLRAIAFLLSAGCVVASSLPSRAQSQLSDRCSRAHQAKAWHAAEGKAPQIPTRVESVSFEGDIHMPVPQQEQIAEEIKQRSWTSDPSLSELNNMAGEAVREKWQERGYFKAEVTRASANLMTSSPSQQVAAMTVYVQEGPLYRLGDITFNDLTVFPHEQLRALFPMQSGDVFNSDKVRVGLGALRSFYGTQGYINFTSVPDTQVDASERFISLVIDADQGKQFHVMQTDVVGLDQGRADILLQRWPLKPGDVYNTSRVEQFFQQNASLLPVGASPEHNLVRKLDEHQATVAFILDFRLCQ
jgi:outer membrane protein assembly factor BamA